MIALNSKTYIGWDDVDNVTKLSTKSVSKATNQFTPEDFRRVLTTGESVDGTNYGLRLMQHFMHQYKQQKRALSYLYPKRIIAPDHVSTTPLKICELTTC